jgi:putative Holliday junction resolvase
MGRILAIDYGRKRTGLAVTDELRIIATPLDTVSSGKTIDFLKRYAASNTVDCFVVGESKDLRNNPSESARFIEPFVKTLKREFPAIPVERIDERFTSVIASRAIRESGLKKKERQDKGLVDQVSAVLILQSYMEAIESRRSLKFKI